MSDSQAGVRSVSRERLYEEIWQTPRTKLSKKYNVSDVAISKACRRHDIPRPPPGYWAMKKHGYEVERTPLPPIKDPALATVHFHPQPSMALPGGADGTGADAKSNRAPIRIPERLSNPHPLVENARVQLRAARTDEQGLVRADSQTSLNIIVGTASVTRALKLMDALIKAWEEIGGSVKPGVKNFQGHFFTAFNVESEEILVTLRERTEPVPNWTPSRNAPWQRRPPYRPSGRLAFSIDYYQADGLRSSWVDGKHQRLDNILNRILDGLVVHSEAEKRRRLDLQCEGRQKAAAEEHRNAQKRRDEQESERRKHLADEVHHWHEANRIRAYLSALHQSLDSGESRIVNEKVFAEWTAWAAWYADHLDPLIRANIRPHVAEPPINKPRTEMDLTSRTNAVVSMLAVADADHLHAVTKAQIEEVEPQYVGKVWSEVCRVLEGLRYDVSDRQYWR